jgi:hypothetical protein
MAVRYILVFILGYLFISCEKKDTNSTHHTDFQKFAVNLRKLEVGFAYDYVKEDAEGAYIPDKNDDSLYYPVTYPIMGVLGDTTFPVAIIHFEPGDDLAPFIRTFDSNGTRIDQKYVGMGLCAAGSCEIDECEEIFKVNR